MMKSRITIYDIAMEMGVSASTVTRALNGKNGVSEELRQAIVTKAQEVGYRTNRLAKSLSRDTVKIAMMVNNRIMDFHGSVIEGAKKALLELSDFNVEGQFQMIPCNDLRNNVLTELRKLEKEHVDGIIFVPNVSHAYDDAIHALARQGIAVGTVIVNCDNDEVAFSVCPNCLRAGRLAADIFHMNGFPEGAEVMIMQGFSNLRNHQECVEGFCMQNERYHFNVVNVLQHYDDTNIAYEVTKRFLIEVPTVRGIYCCTGISAPACKAVCDLGMQDSVKVIGTEVTKEVIPYIESGLMLATMFQDPFQQGKKAFRKMYEYIESGKRKDAHRTFSINPEIVLSGNLDYYSTWFNGIDTDDVQK